MITPRRLLALIGKSLLILIVTVFCAAYLGDEVYFQYRVHSKRSADAYGAVDMQHLLAIELKGGKVQYTMDRLQPEQIQQCVHSLFPHGGLSPCWYLLRKSTQAIPIVILPVFRG
jgi:hypothetical protein